MLHAKISIRESRHGRGLFLDEPVAAGALLIEFDGQRISWDEAVARGVGDYAVPISADLYADNADLEDLINHSCEPNTGFTSNTTLTALTDLSADTELTFDYSLVTIDDWTMKCLCESETCRGEIRNFTDLPKDVQVRYMPITPTWVLQHAGLA